MSGRRTLRRARMRRWPMGLDPRTEANLRLKASAHGVSRPAYVRALINGERPGAAPGSEAALADAWWDSRSPKRRAAIWRNHANAAAAEGAPEDQLTIFDVPDDGAEA